MTIIVIILFLSFSTWSLMQLPVFGANVKPDDKMKNSPNFKNGVFHNIEPTPMQAEGTNITTLIYKFLFTKVSHSVPQKQIPSVKHDLTSNLSFDSPVITWFGHSSYLIQFKNYNILVDPVISESPSPVKGVGTKAFSGTNVYHAEDFPIIDLLIITHDHYDHLDFKAITELKQKVKKVICPLGVKAHFVKWNIDQNIITELDWWDNEIVSGDIVLTCVPARHFSGRKFKRNNTLWCAYALRLDRFSIFIGGDSGYGTHFKTIGNTLGPFDLAILECGQYNKMWPYIHMFPHEVVQAAIDLKSNKILPVHWSKFKLALHAWDEPIEKLLEESNKSNIHVITPCIGQSFGLMEENNFKRWWRDLA